MAIPLDILSLRVEPVKQIHALLVHGKHNTTTQNQSRQPRQRTAPESQNTLLLKDNAGAPERVAIKLLGLNTLHSRLDRIQRLSDVDGDQTRNTAHRKGSDSTELLPGRRVAFGQLLEGGIG